MDHIIHPVDAVDDAPSGRDGADAQPGRRGAGGDRPLVILSPAVPAARRRMCWPGVVAEAIHIAAGGAVDIRLVARSHLLVVHDVGGRQSTVTITGPPELASHAGIPKLTLIPAGFDYREGLQAGGVARLLCLYVDPSELGSHPEWNAAGLSLSPRPFFDDLTLLTAGLKLLDLVEDDTPENRHYAEALATVLVHELVRQQRAGPAIEQPARGGLATWQQHIVADYVRDHLVETVPLATLARLARLSPFHFARAFKHTFGVPPHRYVVCRRIERAKELLADRALPVTTVARSVGFSETSSFSTAFRRLTGASPSVYRRSLD